MAVDKITKIYDLSLLGDQDVIKGMGIINRAFDDAKKNFIDYKNAVKSGNTEANAEFQKARIELLKQQTAQKNLKAETIAYNNALNAQKQASKQAADSAKVVAGSYQDLANRAKVLRAALKGNFVLEGVDVKNVQAGTAELKKLTDQMKVFDRSLSKDGTLVGEYTTGINRSFASLRQNMAGLILGFVGFQAVIGGFRSAFDQVVRLDSVEKAMEVVSGSQEELATNNLFLKETTELLGQSLLDSTVAFKNFYASSTQAGISAADTRDIFFAASSASANLKLSQEDTNGVLLAFGQIASKGKVQAEELRGQIGERLPGAFSIAAKAMNVTQKELNKMLELGKVASVDFLPKFAAELQKTFGTTEHVEGLQASIARLGNEFTDLVDQNQSGLSKLIDIFIAIARAAFGFIKILTSIPFAAVITVMTAAAAVWAYYKGNVIAASIAQAWNNRESALGVIRKFAERIGILNVTAARQAETAATRSATVAQEGLNVAQKASPLGFLLGLLAIIIPVMTAFGDSAQEAADSIDHQNLGIERTNELLRQRQAISPAAKQGQREIDIGNVNPEDQEDFSRITRNILIDDFVEKGIAEAALPRTLARLRKELSEANDAFESAVLGSPEAKALKLKITKLQKEISLNDATDEKPDKKAESERIKAENERIAENIRIEKIKRSQATDNQKWQDDFHMVILDRDQALRNNEITKLRIDFQRRRNLILADTTLTAKQRAKLIQELENAETRTILSKELELLNQEVAQKKILFDRSLIDAATYLDAVKRQQEKAGQLQSDINDPKKQALKNFLPSGINTQNAGGAALADKLKLTDEDSQALLGNVISNSFDLANQAMNNYFDNEHSRIEQSKQSALDRFDKEEELALKRATTKAEEEVIAKQFDQKRRNAEKQAFEQHKKLKRSEATIALATELANIAVAAAANPLNAYTFGGAGAAMYAVLAGLALGRFALNLNSINNQKFARGGIVPGWFGRGGLPYRGGQFTGPSHEQGGIPVGNSEFEGDELAIINKRAAKTSRVYSVTGTPKQIASSINTIGGGLNFAPGGSMFKYADGGYLGSFLQPPVFSSYSSSGDMGDVKNMIMDVTRLMMAESIKPVVLSERGLTAKQKESQRNVEIGML